MENKKLTKLDWLVTGLQFLSEKGEDLIRIENLCRELKVSKGSFYHHFKNVDDFIIELMKYWEKVNTIEIIQDTEKEKGFKSKVEALNAIVMEKDHLLEVRIRAWGVRNLTVNSFIAKVDLERIKYLESLYLQNGKSAEKAEDLARIEYAAFVGMQHLFRDISPEEKHKLSQVFFQLLNN